MGEEEFTALFHEMSGRLFSFAAKRLPAQSADDAVAQTFETVWDKRHECPADHDARIGWVFTIGRYKVLQEVQRLQRKHHDNRFVDDPAVSATPVPDVSEAVADSAAGHWVYRQLTTLERELFDVAFMRDVTREQAAAMLAISVGTFNTRVSRLRRRIHELQRSADAAEGPAGGGAV